MIQNVGYLHDVGLKLVSILALASLSTAVEAAVDTSYELPPLQWHQISFPAELYPPENTLSTVIGDDFSDMVYGEDYLLFEWLVGDSSDEEEGYRLVAEDEIIVAGRGYWIIHSGTESVTIDLPTSAQPKTGLRFVGCVDQGNCVAIPLNDVTVGESTDPIWTMVGSPRVDGGSFSDVRIVSSQRTPLSSECANGCTLEQSSTVQITDDTFYRWNSVTGLYDAFGSGDAIPAWGGFWTGSYGTVEDIQRVMMIPVLAPTDISCPCLTIGSAAVPPLNSDARVVAASINLNTGSAEYFAVAYSSAVDTTSAYAVEIAARFDFEKSTDRGNCGLLSQGENPVTGEAKQTSESGAELLNQDTTNEFGVVGSPDNVAEYHACVNAVLNEVGPIRYSSGQLLGDSL